MDDPDALLSHQPQSHPTTKAIGWSFIHYTDLYSASSMGLFRSSPHLSAPNNTDFSCRRNVMIESMFWEVIREPRRDCSRLSDKQRDSTILPGGGVGKMNLKETLLSRTSGAGTDGPAPVSKVVRG